MVCINLIEPSIAVLNNEIAVTECILNFFWQQVHLRNADGERLAIIRTIVSGDLIIIMVEINYAD